MAVPVIVVKALLLGATDKKTRNIFAIIIAAILVPFIAIILIILSFFGNLESANNSLLDYSFTDIKIPENFNVEQRTTIENMREQLAELNVLIAEKEENSLDGNMVRAVFYTLQFGVEIPENENILHYEKFPDGTVKCIEDEIPFELPQGWEWCRLGVIGDWGAGATPSRTNSNYYGGNIPWLKTGDLNDGYILEIPESISELALKETSVRLNPAGSVLIAMYGATIGKLGILTFPSTTNQACCACIPSLEIEQLYLFYYLLSQREQFIQRGVGGAQPNISKEKIITTLIPLPPRKEQKRLIQKVDETFSFINDIDKGRSNILEMISFAKSKILDLAIRGKLVPQDPNDEPASVLLKHIRDEKEELIRQGKIKRDKKESVIFRGEDNYDYACEFIDEYAAVMKNYSWGFIDKNGNTVIPFEYNGAFSFVNGLAPVYKDELWGFIDEKNNIVIPFQYKDIALIHSEIDDTYMYLDENNNEIIYPND